MDHCPRTRSSLDPVGTESHAWCDPVLWEPAKTLGEEVDEGGSLVVGLTLRRGSHLGRAGQTTTLRRSECKATASVVTRERKLPPVVTLVGGDGAIRSAVLAARDRSQAPL